MEMNDIPRTSSFMKTLREFNRSPEVSLEEMELFAGNLERELQDAIMERNEAREEAKKRSASLRPIHRALMAHGWNGWNKDFEGLMSASDFIRMLVLDQSKLDAWNEANKNKPK
jgi:hypothetical protein